MLKTFTAALVLTVAMSFGAAQAAMHKHMLPSCGEGQQAKMTCACSDAMTKRHLICKKGQWCHSFMNTCSK